MRISIDQDDTEAYLSFQAMLREIGDDHQIAVYVDGEPLKYPTMADDVNGEARHIQDVDWNGKVNEPTVRGHVEIKVERKPNDQG